jgi:hypothetical protein
MRNLSPFFTIAEYPSRALCPVIYSLNIYNSRYTQLLGRSVTLFTYQMRRFAQLKCGANKSDESFQCCGTAEDLARETYSWPNEAGSVETVKPAPQSSLYSVSHLFRIVEKGWIILQTYLPVRSYAPRLISRNPSNTDVAFSIVSKVEAGASSVYQLLGPEKTPYSILRLLPTANSASNTSRRKEFFQN